MDDFGNFKRLLDLRWELARKQHTTHPSERRKYDKALEAIDERLRTEFPDAYKAIVCSYGQ